MVCKQAIECRACILCGQWPYVHQQVFAVAAAGRGQIDQGVHVQAQIAAEAVKLGAALGDEQGVFLEDAVGIGKYGFVGAGLERGAAIVELEQGELAAGAVDEAQVGHNARQPLNLATVVQIAQRCGHKAAYLLGVGIE